MMNANHVTIVAAGAGTVSLASTRRAVGLSSGGAA